MRLHLDKRAAVRLWFSWHRRAVGHVLSRRTSHHNVQAKAVFIINGK